MITLSDHALALSKDIINGTGDCVGLWAAFLLARPFIDSQILRNIILRFEREIPDVAAAVQRAGAKEFVDAEALSKNDLQRQIDEDAEHEYRRGLRGARLLAVAFGIKLIPFLYAIYEAASSILV